MQVQTSGSDDFLPTVAFKVDPTDSTFVQEAIRQLNAYIAPQESITSQIQNVTVASTKSAETVTMNKSASQGVVTDMTESYSKEIVDLKLENLEQRIDSKLEKVLSELKSGFSSMKENIEWMKWTLVFGFAALTIALTCIIYLSQANEAKVSNSIQEMDKRWDVRQAYYEKYLDVKVGKK